MYAGQSVRCHVSMAEALRRKNGGISSMVSNRIGFGPHRYVPRSDKEWICCNPFGIAVTEFPPVPPPERESRPSTASACTASITTSDNICHIKCQGVGRVSVWKLWRAFHRESRHSTSVQDFTKWFERVSNVRLGGGVVSKVARVLICACASAAAIAWAAHDKWICLIALILMFGLCFPLLWRLVNFADKNPQAALFEGAQFLAHERLRLGTKASPLLPADSSPPQPPSAQPRLEDGSASDTDPKQ